MALDKVFGFVLVAICLFAMTVAFNMDSVETMAMDDSSSDNDLERVELDKAIVALGKLKQLFDARKQNGQCSCNGLTCQCCEHIKVREIHLDAPYFGLALLEMNCSSQVLMKDYIASVTGRMRRSGRRLFSIDGPVTEKAQRRHLPVRHLNTGILIVALTIDGQNVFKAEFPVSKPISHCFKFKVAKVCLKFHDFHLDSKALSGCTRISFSILHHEIAHFELGCFHINFLDSSKPLLSVETPVVEPWTTIKNAEGILYMNKANFDEEDRVIGEDNKI